MNMKKSYETFCFEGEPDWQKVPVGKIDCFQWENEEKYRPQSTFQMCLVKGKGVFVKMHSDETKLRTVCTERDEHIWEDSCLEFFFSPKEGVGYLNTEMNPNSAFLTQVGKDREHRRFLKKLTSIAPQVCGYKDENGWGVSLFIPCKVFSEAFGINFEALPGTYSGNFYKCGDKTERPHYGSFSPMRKELTCGFHDPEYFATITVKEDVSKNG